MGNKQKPIEELTPEELQERLLAAEKTNAEQANIIAQALTENEKLQAELKTAELSKGAQVIKLYKKNAYKFLANSFTIPSEDGTVKYMAEELENDSPIIGQLLDMKSGILTLVKEVE